MIAKGSGYVRGNRDIAGARLVSHFKYIEHRSRELHWYAVHHQNTDHPHVHVIVAGAGYSEETEHEEPVKLYAKDYQMLHDSGHDHSDYRFHQLL